MNIKNLKKSISLNILSAIGCIYVPISIWITFIIQYKIFAQPLDTTKYYEDIVTMREGAYLGIIANYIVIALIIFTFFIILTIIEGLLRKYKKIPEYSPPTSKWFSFLFWNGLLLQSFPVVSMFLSLFIPIDFLIYLKTLFFGA